MGGQWCIAILVNCHYNFEIWDIGIIQKCEHGHATTLASAVCETMDAQRKVKGRVHPFVLELTSIDGRRSMVSNWNNQDLLLFQCNVSLTDAFDINIYLSDAEIQMSCTTTLMYRWLTVTYSSIKVLFFFVSFLGVEKCLVGYEDAYLRRTKDIPWSHCIKPLKKLF